MELRIQKLGYGGLADRMMDDYVAIFGHRLYGRSVFGLAVEIEAHLIGYKDVGTKQFKVANLEGEDHIGNKNYYYSEIIPSGYLVYKGFKLKNKYFG